MEDNVDIVGSDIADNEECGLNGKDEVDDEHTKNDLNEDSKPENTDSTQGASDNDENSSASSSEDGNDSEIDIDAIGLELGESLWAGIAQTYSTTTNQSTNEPTNPEQKLIPTIQRILTYLTLDQEVESVFKSHFLNPQPHSPDGDKEDDASTTTTESRDLLSALRSLANTGVVDNDTASALARTIEEIAEDPIFLSEQSGTKRKRNESDDGVQVKEEE